MLVFPSRTVFTLFMFLVVSSAYGHKQVVVIPLGGDDAPPPITYAIGDEGPGGGIVFQVINNGLNGLEVAPVDQAPAPWNCDATDVAGVDNVPNVGTPDSHSGAANTPLIALACPGVAISAAVHAAVYVWPNGQRDGFLPNKEELSILFDQKSLLGGSTSNGYWSSSESNSTHAWVQNFIDGSQYPLLKVFTPSVRAVRAF